MPTPAELTEKFWKAIDSDRTVMLGMVGADGGHTRPMTAQIEDDQGPVWFFTSTEAALVQNLHPGAKAYFAFESKGHDLFASVHGTLTLDNDRAVIDRLWNSYVAAWYEGGKDDPKLALLRFDASEAEIWEDGSSLLAGVKAALGIDPKDDYKDQTAKVSLA